VKAGKGFLEALQLIGPKVDWDGTQEPGAGSLALPPLD
jgi:hypothetical protein